MPLNRCDDVYLAVRVKGHTHPVQDQQVKTDSYITVSQSRPEPQEEVSGSEVDVLKVQLRQAEETAHWVQREVPAVNHI